MKLLIVSGQPNTPVYVTEEGRDLRQYKLVRSTEATVTYEIPVTANDEPGITVDAEFVRKGNFYGGTQYIKVPPVGRRRAICRCIIRPAEPSQDNQPPGVHRPAGAPGGLHRADRLPRGKLPGAYRSAPKLGTRTYRWPGSLLGSKVRVTSRECRRLLVGLGPLQPAPVLPDPICGQRGGADWRSTK
ncbi:MAG TPA: hypothetical protein VGS58_15185 [Candidatus Sulfopaludibacter sp.]|nr:hypothetical protein [Candidatus Sulfopaludibacter sp.]